MLWCNVRDWFVSGDVERAAYKLLHQWDQCINIILPEITNFHCKSTVAVTEMNILGLSRVSVTPRTVAHCLCVCTLQGKLPAVLRPFVTLDAPSGRFLEQRTAHSPGNADPAWLVDVTCPGQEGNGTADCSSVGKWVWGERIRFWALRTCIPQFSEMHHPHVTVWTQILPISEISFSQLIFFKPAGSLESTESMYVSKAQGTGSTPPPTPTSSLAKQRLPGKILCLSFISKTSLKQEDPRDLPSFVISATRAHLLPP